MIKIDIFTHIYTAEINKFLVNQYKNYYFLHKILYNNPFQSQNTGDVILIENDSEDESDIIIEEEVPDDSDDEDKTPQFMTKDKMKVIQC